MHQFEYVLRRMGLFRQLFSGNITVANISFRMIGGVLAGLSLEAVALFTFVYFN